MICLYAEFTNVAQIVCGYCGQGEGIVGGLSFAMLIDSCALRSALQGVVMGRLRSQQRQREVQVMRFCLSKLGLNVVGEIREPGYLEGGDFFPINADLSMVSSAKLKAAYLDLLTVLVFPLVERIVHTKLSSRYGSKWSVVTCFRLGSIKFILKTSQELT